MIPFGNGGCFGLWGTLRSLKARLAETRTDISRSVVAVEEVRLSVEEELRLDSD